MAAKPATPKQVDLLVRLKRRAGEDFDEAAVRHEATRWDHGTISAAIDGLNRTLGFSKAESESSPQQNRIIESLGGHAPRSLTWSQAHDLIGRLQRGEVSPAPVRRSPRVIDENGIMYGVNEATMHLNHAPETIVDQDGSPWYRFDRTHEDSAGRNGS